MFTITESKKRVTIMRTMRVSRLLVNIRIESTGSKKRLDRKIEFNCTNSHTSKRQMDLLTDIFAFYHWAIRQTDRPTKIWIELHNYNCTEQNRIDRQTDRQIDRQTDNLTETDTQIE